MNKPLHGKRLYLSGPIEFSPDGPNWRLAPKKVFTERFGLEVFDPFEDPKQRVAPELAAAKAVKDYDKVEEIAAKFVRKDLAMVDHSHLLVANLIYGVQTCGTYHEIINANNLKKPTLLVSELGKEKISSWLYGFVHHQSMFNSWAELYDFLDGVNKGNEATNHRWALIYGLV